MRILIMAAIACTLFSATCRRNKSFKATDIYDALPDVEVALPTDDEEELEYRETRSSLWDLRHTDLKVSFNFNERTLQGKARIKLALRFYETDSVILDAKYLTIQTIDLIENNESIPLNFTYNDSLQLHIKLPRVYTKIPDRPTEIELGINYSTNTYRTSVGTGDAITEDRGLYFINHKNLDPTKPRQIWTQGETESSSRWFPTIDAPNQKTTQRISITVPDSMITLSNGLKISENKNNDGTRTDVWEQKKAHAPYLFMMAVGNWAVVKDRWRDKEVNYLVEKPYEPYARLIFGNTPKMIEFFSTYTGVDFPWDKYSQVVVRDFVSGAMENTSATVHMEQLQHTPRQHVDNTYEDYVSHELFHQWFGDLVTAESWSNITLNESFATYGEYLWREHHYGKDFAEDWLLETKDYALNYAKEKASLVRYKYKNADAVFDIVSYQKGAVILHMLRKQVGDAAFRESIKRYLTNNAYKSAEVAQLRMAFEEVTGQDLNWFFNQWYFHPKHPELSIGEGFDSINSSYSIDIEQKQYHHTYRLPITIRYSIQGKVSEKTINMTSGYEIFSFNSSIKPDWYVIDPENTLLAEIKYLGDVYLSDDNYELYKFFIEPAIGNLIAAYRNSTNNSAKYQLLKQLIQQLNQTSTDNIDDSLWAAYRQITLGELNAPSLSASLEMVLRDVVSEIGYSSNDISEYESLLNNIIQNPKNTSFNRYLALSLLHEYSKDFTADKLFPFSNDTSAYISSWTISKLPDTPAYLQYAKIKGINHKEADIAKSWYRFVLKQEISSDSTGFYLIKALNRPSGPEIFPGLFYEFSGLTKQLEYGSGSENSEAELNRTLNILNAVKKDKGAVRSIAAAIEEKYFLNYLLETTDDLSPEQIKIRDWLKEIKELQRFYETND